ncbi:MAG TPA: hypothetical protein VFA42_08810, partial [Gaiellaceae bacterium]|nr:hypothetical protein [Gaiellaceae bacterium]
VNDRISELEEGFRSSELVGFVCECSRLGCARQVRAWLHEYASVRAHPRRFLVAHGHIDPDYERIVTRTDRYLVIEKLGLAGEIADDEAP